MVKTCRTCNFEKLEKDFAISDKKAGTTRRQCKECDREQKREYYRKNREQLIVKNRLHAVKNAERVKAYQKQHRKIYRELHDDRIKKRHLEYYTKHKDEIYVRVKKRRSQNPLYGFRQRISRRVNFEMKGGKKGKTLESLSININQILEHLGQRPTKIHHLDHIIPIKVFDYTNPMHIAASWHHSNLQWLTGPENLEKGAKYDELEFKHYLTWYETSVWPTIQLIEQTG